MHSYRNVGLNVSIVTLKIQPLHSALSTVGLQGLHSEGHNTEPFRGGSMGEPGTGHGPPVKGLPPPSGVASYEALRHVPTPSISNSYFLSSLWNCTKSDSDFVRLLQFNDGNMNMLRVILYEE